VEETMMHRRPRAALVAVVLLAAGAALAGRLAACGSGGSTAQAQAY
jgi:hypothetical protein